MKTDSSLNITKELIRFSVPLILSGIFQQLYSWVDALIVGNFAGQNALGAIGTTTAPYDLLLGLILSISSAVTILSARYYGANQKEKLARLFATFLRIMVLLGIGVAVLGIAFCRPLLLALDTPLEILSDASVYLSFLYAGIPFLAVYNTCAALLRGMGNSKAPFRAVMISGMGNLIFDLLFVAKLGYGITGAAAATLMTQAVMALYLLRYMHRHAPEYALSISGPAFDREIFAEGMNYAIPLIVQNLVSSGGRMVLSGFRNGFGIAVITAITTSYRIDTMLILPIRNLMVGISTMVSQKIGAKQNEDLPVILKSGIVLSILFELLVMAFVITQGGNVIALFGADREVQAIGARFFKDMSIFYIVFGFMNIFTGYLQGCGDVKYTSTVQIAGLGLRILFSYVLVGFFDWEVIAFAEGLSWTIAVILLVIRYKTTIRKIRDYN